MLYFVTTATSLYFFVGSPLHFASKAGVGSPENPEQLVIALEPEAAAIFCQEKKMSDFYSETGTKAVDGILSTPNSHYMVVDIGGNELCCSVSQ